MACEGNRMTRRGSLAATLLLAGVIASRAAGQDSAEVVRVRAELDRLYALNAEAFIRGDVPALMELRADGFHTIAADGSARDRAAMQVYMQGIINGIRKWNQITFVIDSLTVVGDTAIAVVWQFLDRMGLRPDTKGHHVQTWVTQRETWLRRDNRWLLWRDNKLRSQRRLIDGRAG